MANGVIHAVADLVVVLSEYRADANQRPSHMLAWPHSGLHEYDEVWVVPDDSEFAVRLARYCVRTPVALSRLEYQSDNQSDNATLT